MTMNPNANPPFQQEFNRILAEKLTAAMPGKLDGPFMAVTYPAGVNYGITYGPNAYYNKRTLSTMDSTVQTDSDGISCLSNQKLSDLYCQVLKSVAFVFSKDTQKQLNDWDSSAESQVPAVLNAFEECGGEYSDPLPFGGKIADVFNQLTDSYGPLDESLDNLPTFLGALKNALATYIEMQGKAYTLHSRAAQATSILSAAIQNTTKPAAKNGGLQTDKTSYYVAFDKLPSANALIGSLGTSENALTLHLAGDSFTSTDCKIHVENEGVVEIPIAGLFDIKISHESKIDISKFTSRETSFSMEITYPGLTTVGVIPLSLSPDNQLGWYSVNILREIQEKTGDDNVDGYKLLGSEFSVEELFGIKGKLNFLKTLVISREPTIDVTFKKVDVEQFKKHIHTDNNVQVTLFGFIPLGTVDHSYTLDKVETNEDEQSVTLHLSAPEVSGTIPLDQQVAYLLGGVSAYVGNMLSVVGGTFAWYYIDRRISRNWKMYYGLAYKMTATYFANELSRCLGWTIGPGSISAANSQADFNNAKHGVDTIIEIR